MWIEHIELFGLNLLDLFIYISDTALTFIFFVVMYELLLWCLVPATRIVFLYLFARHFSSWYTCARKWLLLLCYYRMILHTVSSYISETLLVLCIHLCVSGSVNLLIRVRIYIYSIYRLMAGFFFSCVCSLCRSRQSRSFNFSLRWAIGFQYWLSVNHLFIFAVQVRMFTSAFVYISAGYISYLRQIVIWTLHVVCLGKKGHWTMECVSCGAVYSSLSPRF